MPVAVVRSCSRFNERKFYSLIHYNIKAEFLKIRYICNIVANI